MACRVRDSRGAAFYTTDNPPFGAVFTYHLKETIKTEKQKRRDLEKAAAKKKDLSHLSGAMPHPLIAKRLRSKHHCAIEFDRLARWWSSRCSP
jgi:hypothetical protein